MENVPKIVAQRLRVPPLAAEHPDANMLTAFAEKSLSPLEREKVLQHLASCGDCREVVVLALPEAEPVQTAPAVVAHRTWPALRWGFALAGIVIIGFFGAVLYKRQGLEPVASYKSPQAVTDAKNESTAQPAAEERAKAQTPQAAAAPSTPSEEGSPKLKSSPEGTSGGPAPARVDALAQKPLPHGPRSTNQLAQWQQNASSAGAAPAPAPPLPLAKQGRLIANERVPASSEAIQVESQSNSLDMQSQDQGALLARNVPAAPPDSHYAEQKVDKAKPADTVAGSIAAAPYPARPAKLSSSGFPMWSIDSAGRLQRSFDQGNTFEIVEVQGPGARFNARARTSIVAGKKDVAASEPQLGAPIIFRAVAANGSEVWAGGSAGQLYHSTNAGNTWARVVPTGAGFTLTGDIIGLDFPDTQHGKVSTSTSEVWITSDNGQSWQKQ